MRELVRENGLQLAPVQPAKQSGRDDDDGPTGCQADRERIGRRRLCDREPRSRHVRELRKAGDELVQRQVGSGSNDLRADAAEQEALDGLVVADRSPNERDDERDPVRQPRRREPEEPIDSGSDAGVDEQEQREGNRHPDRKPDVAPEVSALHLRSEYPGDA